MGTLKEHRVRDGIGQGRAGKRTWKQTKRQKKRERLGWWWRVKGKYIEQTNEQTTNVQHNLNQPLKILFLYVTTSKIILLVSVDEIESSNELCHMILTSPCWWCFIKILFFLFLFFREKANLSVSIVDEHNVLVGHGAFYDQPNWSIDKSMHWVDWLRSNFNVSHCDVSLFILV